MGNPHAVLFCDLSEDIDTLCVAYGPLIERLGVFPERTNVEFVQILPSSSYDSGSSSSSSSSNNYSASHHMKLRVWERGCGFTKACGTGACAAVVAAKLLGLLHNASNSNPHAPTNSNVHAPTNPNTNTPCRVSLPGGDLIIEWPGVSDSGIIGTVLMRGPAVLTFIGEVLV